MQSSLSNVRSPAQKGTDPSIDDLTAQISKLSFMLEAAEKIMVAVCCKTIQSAAPNPPKSGEDKEVRTNIVGLTPHLRWVGPTATVHTVQSTLPPTHSPHNFFNIDTSFNKLSPCGPTPPISPTFSWPSDLGSSAFSPIYRAPTKHEDVLIPEDIGGLLSNNPSLTIPLLASPAPPAQAVLLAPATPTISRIGHVNIPIGYYIVSYNSILIVLPSEGTHGPFYLIT
ncbi:hypothetical protein EDD16DRAFT_1706532 [Pisolithus croceorrhizus]|nr:hypothetical protein EDD16DRAFT_1706532 [Pisolithus croceorrhizus]KAI6120377.1 hypothetical protein EV401DRAFT_2070669 [Pisolithus croceorrhizus]KAI6166318.1 hypothetical protein EDD17DRAFT_1753148 [Pisolithus thermaeus]